MGTGAPPACQALLGRRQPDARCPQVWEKNRKLKSFNLSALEKHGPVYEDGEALAATGGVGRGAAAARAPPDWPSRPDCFGCLSWSHSETHLLYVAEKKRPKTESFFQTKALDVSDDDMAEPKKPDQAIKVLRAAASPGGPRGSPGLRAPLPTLHLAELGGTGFRGRAECLVFSGGPVCVL